MLFQEIALITANKLISWVDWYMMTLATVEINLVSFVVNSGACSEL
jgi:hypothetical protein